MKTKIDLAELFNSTIQSFDFEGVFSSFWSAFLQAISPFLFLTAGFNEAASTTIFGYKLYTANNKNFGKWLDFIIGTMKGLPIVLAIGCSLAMEFTSGGAATAVVFGFHLGTWVATIAALAPFIFPVVLSSFAAYQLILLGYKAIRAFRSEEGSDERKVFKRDRVGHAVAAMTITFITLAIVAFLGVIAFPPVLVTVFVVLGIVSLLVGIGHNFYHYYTAKSQDIEMTNSEERINSSTASLTRNLQSENSDKISNGNNEERVPLLQPEPAQTNQKPSQSFSIFDYFKTLHVEQKIGLMHLVHCLNNSLPNKNAIQAALKDTKVKFLKIINDKITDLQKQITFELTSSEENDIRGAYQEISKASVEDLKRVNKILLLRTLETWVNHKFDPSFDPSKNPDLSHNPIERKPFLSMSSKVTVNSAYMDKLSFGNGELQSGWKETGGVEEVFNTAQKLFKVLEDYNTKNNAENDDYGFVKLIIQP